MKKYYHKCNGRVYCQPSDIKTLEEYQQYLKKGYGNLQGIKIFQAINRTEAEYKK